MSSYSSVHVEPSCQIVSACVILLPNLRVGYRVIYLHTYVVYYRHFSILFVYLLVNSPEYLYSLLYVLFVCNLLVALIRLSSTYLRSYTTRIHVGRTLVGTENLNCPVRVLNDSSTSSRFLRWPHRRKLEATPTNEGIAPSFENTCSPTI